MILHIFYNTFSLLHLTLCSLIIMNSQQNSFQCKKIIVLLLMQEVFKKNNRVFNANTHLLTFTFYTNKQLLLKRIVFYFLLFVAVLLRALI